MIFRDYNVIVYLNLVLLTVLALSLIYLSTLEARYRRAERRKEHCFDRWEEALVKAVTSGGPFDPGPCLRPDWFAEFVTRWYTSFRGATLEQVGRICRETGLVEKISADILRGTGERELIALRFFTVSGLVPDAALRARFADAIGPAQDFAGSLRLQLAARALGKERTVDLVRATAASPFLSPTMQIEILREMLPALKDRYGELIAACRDDGPARLLLLEAAGRLWVTEACPALRDIFRGTGNEERIRSMRSLAALHCDDMKDEIYAHYRAEQHPVLQTLAFKSFLALADEEDVARVAPELDSRNWFVRYHAAKALARFGAAGLAVLNARPVHDACALALAERGETAANHHEHLHVR